MRIMHIKRTIRTWTDKFNDLLFKSTKQVPITNFITEHIPLNNSGWKKRVLEAFMFNIKYRGDIYGDIMISGSLC